MLCRSSSTRAGGDGMALQNLFTSVLNMSITGTAVIAAVLLARLALRKAPRVYSYALWAVVLLRLLCPVTLPSPVSVWNAVEVPQSAAGAMEFVEMPVQTPAETVIPVSPGQTVETVPVSQEPPLDWNLMAGRAWAAGVLLLAGYGAVSYVNLKRKLRETAPAEPGVREFEGAASPFVFGILRPVIYLPLGLSGREREYILRHERYHVRHFDPQVRMVFYAAVCLHWFNPAVWLAFFLCARDMEMRCDEAVLETLDLEVRSDYAQSLLNFATGRYALAAPLAFGEGDTGKRVRNVLNWKKKAPWLMALGAAVCALVFLMTGCGPETDAELASPFGHRYRAVSIVSERTVDESVMTYEFVLTEDRGVFVNGNATGGDWLVPAAEGTQMPSGLPEGNPAGKNFKGWYSPDGRWWLFQNEEGLWLWREGEYLVKLKRLEPGTVALRVTNGVDMIEPVWCPGGDLESKGSLLSVTLSEEKAQLLLVPGTETERLMVSERYTRADSPDSVLVTDTVLEPNSEGEFLLDIARRGETGEDWADYVFTVAGETYTFRVVFPDLTEENVPEPSGEEATNKVTYNDGAFIALDIPVSWEFRFSHPEDGNGSSGGIDFWPAGYEDSLLQLHYHLNGFGVCGTGLETAEMELAGRTVSVGTYDGGAVWDYIAFGDDFAVWGTGHEVWWEEYGETAMKILDSAVLGPQQD